MTKLLDKERNIKLLHNKTSSQKVLSQLIDPCSRGLIKAIQGLLQLAHQQLISLVLLKTWWLKHTNILCKISIQEIIIDIHLFELPAKSGNQDEHHSNGCWFDNWTESFLKINPHFMQVALDSQFALISWYRAICIPFQFKDLLISHNFLVGKKMN